MSLEIHLNCEDNDFNLFNECLSYQRFDLAKKIILQGTIQPCTPHGKKDQTALHAVVLHGQKDLLQHLLGLKDCEVDVQNAEGDSPLHLACKIKDISCAELLICVGADINFLNHQFNSP